MKKRYIITAALSFVVIAGTAAAVAGCVRSENGEFISPYVFQNSFYTRNEDSAASFPGEESSGAESSEEEDSQQSLESIPEESAPESSKPQESSGTVSQASVPVKKTPDPSVIKDLDKKYFVSKLSKKQLDDFAAVYDAAMNFEKEAEFPKGITDDELTTIMFLLNYDCPELIHVGGEYYPVHLNSKVVSVGLSYCMDEEKYKSAKKELDNYFSKLRSELSGKSDIDAEKAVYDRIFSTCIYDEYDAYSGSVYGGLISGRARCEGLCKSFMWCMRELGIDCLCVSGPQSWNSSALYSDHSWNIVKINGSFYHLDLTLDDVNTDNGFRNIANYGFFNVDDEMIYRSRSVNEVFTNLGIPVCSTDECNYHKMNYQLIKMGEGVQSQLFRMLDEHYSENGIEAFSVRCETETMFSELGSEIYIWLSSYLEEKSGDNFKINTYASELSYSMVIEAIKRQEG